MFGTDAPPGPGAKSCESGNHSLGLFLFGVGFRKHTFRLERGAGMMAASLGISPTGQQKLQALHSKANL
jgi:hypothetical protein